MAELATATTDPTNALISLIADIAKNTNSDNFKIRIQRKTPAAPYPVIFAAFDDATVEQIAHPEGWLTQIGGGGTYLISVFHPIESSKVIGAPLTVQAGGPTKQEPIDHTILNDNNWRGPRALSYPVPPRQDIRPTNGTIPFIGISAPGGGTGSPPRIGDQQNPFGAAPASQYERDRADLDRQREDLRRQTLENERDRHRSELESQRRATELEIAKLRTELKPQGGGSDMLATLIVEMNKQSNAASERLADAQRRSDERMAALMAQQAQAQAAQLSGIQDLNKLLMTQLLTKPAMDPLIEKLLAKESEGAATTVKVVQQMAEATGSVVQMMVGALHAVSELNNGPAEPPLMGAIKEAIRAFAVMQQNSMQPPPPQPMIQPQQVAPRAPTPASTPAPAPAPTAAPHLGDADGSKLNAFDQVVRAIRERRNATEVATFFIDNLEEPSVKPKMDAAGGNPLTCFQPHLADWLNQDPKNMPYVHHLLKELQRIYEMRMAAQPQQPAAAEAVAEEEDAEGPEELG